MAPPVSRPIMMTIADGFRFFFFSSRRRHTRWPRDWSSDVCSSDLERASMRERKKLRYWRNPQKYRALARLERAMPGAKEKGAARSEERRVGKEGRSRGSA